MAMLGDVLAACAAVGATRVVTPDEEAADAARDAGRRGRRRPGRRAGRRRRGARSRASSRAAILIVNADVPCVVPHDLRALLAATPAGGFALVEAARRHDERAEPPVARSLRAALRPRQRRRASARTRAALGLEAVSVAVPNLADDVDTIDDLTRLQLAARPAHAGRRSSRREERSP